MRTLHIIMPMAGEGSRFMKEGFITPKPLIPFKGKVLFERAINSVSGINVPRKYSFIVRQEHIDKYQIDKKINEILPDANIFSVQKTTRGAVETCLLAQSSIEKNDAILIMDCDIEFQSINFNKSISEILSQPIEKVNGGLLLSFESNKPCYSYAEIDENNTVLRTAEKEVISNHALCGAYFFSKAESFLFAAYELLNDRTFKKPEFYVSLLYNQLLTNGEVVKLAQMEQYYSYGTPEELNFYL